MHPSIFQDPESAIKKTRILVEWQLEENVVRARASYVPSISNLHREDDIRALVQCAMHLGAAAACAAFLGLYKVRTNLEHLFWDLSATLIMEGE
jgi:4-hydroxy-3-methylbut-2-en-1-yl diphosphate synthase IspG/GcpE